MEPTKHSEPRRFYGRPADRSLQAYKDFVLGMTLALNPASKHDMTKNSGGNRGKPFGLRGFEVGDEKNLSSGCCGNSSSGCFANMGRKAATLYDLPLMFLFGSNGYIENDNRQCAEQCRNNNTHTPSHFSIPFLLRSLGAGRHHVAISGPMGRSFKPLVLR